MNAKEYREALAALDLSQVAAGKMFSVDARTSRRWALGGASVPPLVEMLLNLMVSKKFKLEVNLPASRERRVWTFQAKQAVSAME